MLTITKKFLKKCPQWAKEGWKVGDKCDMCSLDDSTLSTLAKHPPKRPGG